MPIPFVMNRKYVTFYLDGREARVLRVDVDEDELANRVLDGKGSVHDVCLDAAQKEVEALATSRQQRKFVEEHADSIKDANGEASDGTMEPAWGAMAFAHYLAGRTDELADRIEQDTVSAMTAQIYGDEDSDEDDDDDDEEDGDDEDDEGDDEDED